MAEDVLVYLLWHVYEDDGKEEDNLCGVYALKADAEKAARVCEARGHTGSYLVGEAIVL